MANRPTPPTAPRGLPPKPGMMLPMRVWDVPVRLFHWVLVALLLTSWLSIEFFNSLKVHILAGETVLALLLFRLAWGVVGSETARFSHFLGNPFNAVTHLAHLTKKEPDTQIGHNAAGGWMVLAMLVVLLAQTATGLLIADEESFIEAPLNHLVGADWGAWALKQHRLLFTVIQVLVALHLAAIFAYALLKRHDLVRPMVTGKKRLPAATPQPRLASPVLAAALLAVAALAVWALVTKV